MVKLRICGAIALACLLAPMAAAQEDAAQEATPSTPATPATADTPATPAEGDGGAAAIGQFDADSDGVLSGEEIIQAREFLQALRRAIGERRDERGPRPPRERGGEARRGLRDRGSDGDGPAEEGAPRRPRRPREAGEPGAPGEPGPPRPRGPREPGVRPMALFDEFDADSDGELNREEFQALMGAMRERQGFGGPPREGGPEGPGDRPGRGFGRRGGPRDGDPGFGGPPNGEGDDGGDPGRRPRRRGRGGDEGRPPREDGTPAESEAPPFEPEEGR
jgi:hypothetical protein